MSLTLSDVRRIARDVVEQQHLTLDVIGVTNREGSTGSAEVIFASGNGRNEPYRVVIDVSRHLSEVECRGTVRARLTAHLAGLLSSGGT